MAALQKFKLLATQCGVAPSPTRSPRTSPLVQLRRKKTTLRMLLSRNNSSRRSGQDLLNQRTSSMVTDLNQNKSNKEVSGRTLKDLFVLPPSFEQEQVKGIGGGGIAASAKPRGGLKGEPGNSRPGWVGFRYKVLVKRAWRPVLVGIPE